MCTNSRRGDGQYVISSEHRDSAHTDTTAQDTHALPAETSVITFEDVVVVQQQVHQSQLVIVVQLTSILLGETGWWHVLVKGGQVAAVEVNLTPK